MIEPASLLSRWESFYVIVGSSGAALTGLQFVVIALIAGAERRPTFAEINAFGTPTVVHFCTALLVSAIMSAPWTGFATVGVLLALVGVAGVGYAALIVRRAKMQKGYTPVWEDWLWHSLLPLTAYFAFVVSGVLLASHTMGALFTVGATSVGLLFVGIHNSWDTVTYIAVAHKQAAS